MEEDVTRRTVAISVQATKLTGRVLCKAFSEVSEAEMQKQRRASLTPHGRQTVKQLMGQGVSSNSIQLKGDARLFDRVARKFNVDYAFHKVGAEGLSSVLQSWTGGRNHGGIFRIHKARDGPPKRQALYPRTAPAVRGTHQGPAEGTGKDQRGGAGTVNAKIKKYVVPNLPYLVIFWFFCKLGEAYRLAAGADFGRRSS